MNPIDRQAFAGFLTSPTDKEPRSVVFANYSDDLSANNAVSSWMPKLEQTCTISMVENAGFATETLHGTGWDPVMPPIVHALRFWADSNNKKLVNHTDLSLIGQSDNNGDRWFVESWELKKLNVEQIKATYGAHTLNANSGLSDNTEVICDFVHWSNSILPDRGKRFVTMYGWVVYDNDL